MAITVEWDDETHTIIRMVGQDAWDLAELRRTSQQAMTMIRSVPNLVYVLSDFSQTPGIPFGILWELRDLNQMRPTNWAGGIAIAQDSFVTTLVASLSQIYMERQKNRLFVAKNEADAYEIIARWKSEDSLLTH